jgi:ubiquinone/menaquinone biosynthesis C-methylase UbiE
LSEYYSQQLSSNKLKRCYEIAPPRVRQYLRAEVAYVLDNIEQPDIVVELGCGYGRVLKDLQSHASTVIGVDTSIESLCLAKEYLGKGTHCHLYQSDASRLALLDHSVDKVICVQNGISAFNTDPVRLIRESVRITRRGGCCIFSSYSDSFWEYRLEWFKLQSKDGLIGEIDWSRTSNGVIACNDGFRATIFRQTDFERLCNQLGLAAIICEIDESSIFCKIPV